MISAPEKKPAGARTFLSAFLQFSLPAGGQECPRSLSTGAVILAPSANN